MIMKRLFNILIAAAAIATACEPIVKDIPMGGVISEEDLVLSLTNENGGNKILLENKTAGVGSLWDYGIGKSTFARQEIVLPFAGDIPIKFTGICDGGTITVTRTVTVDKITEEIPEEWMLFANGSAVGKEWTWDTEKEWCYGTGGYGWSLVADWSTWSVDNQPEDYVGVISPDDYIRFDLDGGANFTSVIDGKETRGTFVFDMSKGIEGYSLGTLELMDATVPLPWGGYDGPDGGAFYKFDIMELTEETLVLSAALPGSTFEDPEWNDYSTFWSFRKK